MKYNFYIYYKVSPETGLGLRKQIVEMQSLLASETGIMGKLLTKLEDPWIWMEIYENIEDRPVFESTLQRLITDKIITAPAPIRKIEVFYA